MQKQTMRVLVAGATGAVGRPLVSALVAAGYTVAGVTHTAAKKDIIRRLGAEPVLANGLEAAQVQAAVDAIRPDVIVHEMTDLSGVTDLRHFDRSFAKSNLLRTHGTDVLLAAARRAGVKRLVAQSFCGWPYARTGAPIKTEKDKLDIDPPAELRPSFDAIYHLEQSTITSSSPEGIVLRYGTFYGPATGVFEPAMVEQIRRRRVPLIGDGAGWWSFVHVDDAAAATVRAIERGEAGNIYNIVDDEPAQVREWLPELARLLGAKRPLRLPAWIARFLAGDHVVAMMTEVRAGSNAKARTELLWEPAHPSWRKGFADIAARLPTQ
ncbi:NAD-dependent epimerase/dehydratase [Hyphomicrobium denitrificans 1NES1]|uniref:NAD-dependent epimerase/dehydratase n=1 Tax=Hyphomicrobium denitrificans 1NES1 TaxID=670307 RepID=N0BCQ4_9HYPH|nr:NAD(P)-dependent oxidoreductase [Hyphomicrobium denitrificans]AGK56553.1 NAD-dependent epimerase/dehydratase [Hyphomicrobium denitrificans 1NES1]AGK58316.1 NAD-dependent epimerase/dehydratase [Hyphomicrobium denitrificans 1NES1]